jgi:small-conductance mechanosensitive channel
MVFCVMLLFLSLSIVGVNVPNFAISLASAAVAFSFVVGSTMSAFFEGVMMIIARRPYDIGDRIHMSSSEDDTSGSFGWIVEGK